MGDTFNYPAESRTANPKDLENSNITHGLVSLVEDSGGLLMAEAMESMQRNEKTQNEEATQGNYIPWKYVED